MRARLVGFGVLVLIAAASAAGEPAGIAADPAPVVQDSANEDQQAPDLELLEYLGGLVDDDDRWVGPDDMQAAVDMRGPEVVFDDGATAEDEK